MFHYIEFPKPDRLKEIIHAIFPQSSEILVESAVHRFLELREEMREDKGDSSKKVSTSELVDCFKVLRRYPKDQILKQLKGRLPFPQVLLKSWDDHRRYLCSPDNESYADEKLPNGGENKFSV